MCVISCVMPEERENNPMIYTVTMNPSLDYFVKMKNFEFGKTNRTEHENMQPGGKGLNVSIMLRKLSIPSEAVLFTGGFVGSEILKRLQAADILTNPIPVEGDSRINVKLEDFEGTEINGKGPVVSPEDVNALLAGLSVLSDGDVLVLGGSIPTGVPVDIYEKLIMMAKGIAGENVQDEDRCAHWFPSYPETEKPEAPEHGIMTLVDTSGQALLDTLPYHPFLIKPNEDELSELFSRELYFEQDIEDAARTLQGRGAVNVLVSLGNRGAVLVDENGAVHTARAPKGRAVNAVGAGDSMVAGFLYGLKAFGNYEDAFLYSVATGSAAAFSLSFPDKQDIDVIYQDFLSNRR